MRIDVSMPVVTEEGEDGVVTAWFVDEGARCARGQLIAEVQAEKIAAEVHAPADGFVVDRIALNHPVAQGGPICAVVSEVTAEIPPSPRPAEPGSSSVRAPVRASPAAKRLAREIGVDLDGLVGTGPDGRITEADVRGHGAPTALRHVIARNLRRSQAETVPVTLFKTVDLGHDAPDRITARVVVAAAAALAAHPGLNGSRNGDRFEAAAEINISLAVQTEDGLVAPVIHGVHTKSLDEVADSIRDLADRTRARQLSASDFEGGTFSVTNLGGFGIDGFTPVINLPQIAILGVGRTRRIPALADDGSVHPTHEMMLSLTFDHAFIDGAPAAEFLTEVATCLVRR